MSRRSTPEGELEGEYDELFAAVPLALAGYLHEGDAGGSVAVYVDGEPVVDMWGGYADAERTVPWERDTVACVFSVTKTMTALTVLLLADRRELDLDAPVAAYWPEFAAAGKEGVLVRHVLAHTAGLPDWEGPVAELVDWDAATARLAALAPQWEPGTAAGYHSLTQGYLLGEVVRRVTGRSIADVFATEVAGPLGADFQLGLPERDDPRLALAVPPPLRDEDYVAGAAAADAPTTGGTPIRVRDANSVAWRRALVPAAGGYGNARSVAQVQAVLAGGPRLLSDVVLERAFGEQYAGVDRVLGMPVSWGLGYGRFGGVYGWGGWGGSLVMIDPAQRTVVAFVTNQMREPAEDTRGLEVVMSAFAR
jgi:CubicO group peptidase (beta-lactamase class C family)